MTSIFYILFYILSPCLEPEMQHILEFLGGHLNSDMKHGCCCSAYYMTTARVSWRAELGSVETALTPGVSLDRATTPLVT